MEEKKQARTCPTIVIAWAKAGHIDQEIVLYNSLLRGQSAPLIRKHMCILFLSSWGGKNHLSTELKLEVEKSSLKPSESNLPARLSR